MCSSTDGRSEASCGVIVWGGETRGGSDDACLWFSARRVRTLVEDGRRIGGGLAPSRDAFVGTLGGTEKIDSSPRARWSAGTRTVSRRGRSRTRAAYLEDGVHRDAAAGSTRLPRRRSPRRARLNAADVRKYFKTNRLFATREGAHPVWWSSLIRQINDDSTSPPAFLVTSRRPRLRTRGDAMQARRGANFVTNAMPFFAFMVGGSYGISVLLQVRHREAPASTSRVASRSQHALTTRTRRTPRTHHTRRVATTCATRRRT